MRGLEDNVQLVMMDYCHAEAMTLLPDFLQNIDLVQLPLPAITAVSTPSPPLLPSSDSVESLLVAMQTTAKAPIGEVVYAGDQPHSQHLASQLSSLVANSQFNPLAPSWHPPAQQIQHIQGQTDHQYAKIIFDEDGWDVEYLDTPGWWANSGLEDARIGYLTSLGLCAVRCPSLATQSDLILSGGWHGHGPSRPPDHLFPGRCSICPWYSALQLQPAIPPTASNYCFYT